MRSLPRAAKETDRLGELGVLCVSAVTLFAGTTATSQAKLGSQGKRTMLVVMAAHATEEQVRAVCDKIESLGLRSHALPGAQRTAIGVTGNKGEVEPGSIEEMPGVQEVIQDSKPYKLVSRDAKQDNTIVRFGAPVGETEPSIGGPELAVIAGPCAIESRQQAFAVAERGQIGRAHV